MPPRRDAPAPDGAPGRLLLTASGRALGCTLPSALVARFERSPPKTPVPGAPDLVAGIVEIRGRVFTVLDIERLLVSLGHREESKTAPPGGLLLLLAEPFAHIALEVPEEVGVRPATRHDGLPHLDAASLAEILAAARSRTPTR